MDMRLAVKCAPERKILSDIKRAGLDAVELYLSDSMLGDSDRIIKLCNKFLFSYAVHAPRNGYNPAGLAKLARGVNAGIVIFHNIYWEDEWENIIRAFKGVKTKLCLENIFSSQEPLKFMRRYGLGLCLDLEHLQMEGAGFCEEEFIPFMKQASHVHLTGYTYGSRLWHTHIHHCAEHNLRVLDLFKKVGYSGLIVSEAKSTLQTFKEFKELNDFYEQWQGKRRVQKR